MSENDEYLWLEHLPMEHSTINVKPIYLSYILHLILKASSAALQASPDVKHHNPLSNTLPMQSPIRDSQNPMQSNLSGRSSGKIQLKNLPTKTNQKSNKRGRRTKKKAFPYRPRVTQTPLPLLSLPSKWLEQRQNPAKST